MHRLTNDGQHGCQKQRQYERSDDLIQRASEQHDQRQQDQQRDIPIHEVSSVRDYFAIAGGTQMTAVSGMSACLIAAFSSSSAFIRVEPFSTTRRRTP